MGIETAMLLAIGSVALSGVTSFVQAGAAHKQAEQAAQAAADTATHRMRELTRQQEEVQRIAREDRSDVMRRASQELGAIRVAAGEVGATDNAFLRMVQELGYVEGVDLSRIESNRRNQIEALQEEKKAVSQGYLNTTRQLFNQARVQKTQAVLGFVGSALQIGATYDYRSRQLEAMRNRRQ